MVQGLLAPEECRYLMTLAEPRLQPSVIVDPTTGRRRPDPVRKSLGASFGPLEEDIIVHAINRRIARASGTDVQCGEPLHTLCYHAGDQYLPHVDTLPGESNQRAVTVLVYLNDDYVGGETEFDQIGQRFRGRQGDALIFRNLDGAGRPDPQTRHAGLPIITGRKWLATRWIRIRQYHPWAG